jgi:uncharacterized protein with HEPN domain
MIEAAEEAKIDAAEGKEVFMKGGMAQKAVLLDLIHLTESADGMSFSLTNQNSRIPWDRLRGLRSQGLVHHYVLVDLEDIGRSCQMNFRRFGDTSTESDILKRGVTKSTPIVDNERPATGQ